jgi:hypothetical protein
MSGSVPVSARFFNQLLFHHLGSSIGEEEGARGGGVRGGGGGSL